MAVRLTDKLIAPSRGTVKDALAFGVKRNAKRQDFLADYFTELWRLCQKYGFDFSILVAQSVNETNSWRSAVWQSYGNPAGLAVTNSQNLSVVYTSGIEAARAHVVHWYAYRYGRIPSTEELYAYRNLDGHYAAVFATNDTRGNPLAGSVKTIGDLNVNGRWALLDRSNTPTGPLDDYGNRIVSDGRAVWPNLPDQGDPPVTTPSTPPEDIPGEGEPVADLVFGRVPKPPMKVMIVPKGASGQTGWFQCPPRHNVGFEAHETQGMSSGEWYYDFFSCPNGERCKDALVDFLIDPQGVIYMYNDPEGTRAPWANGGGALSSGGLEGDGVAYVDYFGLGAVDTKTISCEIVKNHLAPMTAKQIVSLGKLFAYYADRDQQPWQNWPAIAKYGGTRVYLNHWEIGTTNCTINPDDNDKVIAEVQKNLKAAQADGITPAEPVYAEADPMDAGTFVKNDRLFLEVNKDYTTQRAVKPFKYADFKPEQQTGPEIPKGTKVKVLHVVSDTGATSDLTLEIDAVKVGGETVPKGSRIDGRVIA